MLIRYFKSHVCTILCATEMKQLVDYRLQISQNISKSKIRKNYHYSATLAAPPPIVNTEINLCQEKYISNIQLNKLKYNFIFAVENNASKVKNPTYFYSRICSITGETKFYKHVRSV